MNKAWFVGVMALLTGCVAVYPARPTIPHEITIAGERLFPESIASDAAGNIYVGSNPGSIYRAMRGRQVANVWLVPDRVNGLQSVFGVLVDDARRLLWVCSNPNTFATPRQEGRATVKAFDLANRRLVHDLPIPADAGPAMCNDMTVDSNGDVYVSEMLGGRIFRWRNGSAALEEWAASEHFAAIDGLSFGPNGALYANSIQRNTLMRVEQGADGRFVGVRLLETSAPLDGPDGLRFIGGNRMLQSEGNAGTITVLTFPANDGPVDVRVIASGIDYASSVTMIDGRAFYPEGKLSYMMDPAKRGQNPGSFVIRSAAIPQ